MRALRAVSRLDPRRLPHLVLAAVLFLSVPAAPARAVQESGSQFSALEHAGARLVRSHQDRLKSARLALHPLTLDMVKNAVLERNLDIKVSALARDQAGLQEIERDAVFDSVLGLVVNYTHKDAYSRTGEIGRIRKQDTDFEAMEEKFRQRAQNYENGIDSDPTSNLSDTCVYIDGVLINDGECSSKFSYSLEEEAASYEVHGDKLPDVVTGQFNLSRAFPWGQSVRAGLQSTWSENKYPSLGDYAWLYTYDKDVDAYPYGNNPWASSVSLSVSSPLPYCRNFGEEGNANAVLRRMAALNADAIRFDLETSAAKVLLAALNAWWDLAQKVGNWAIAVEARRHLEDMAVHIDRLKDQGERTSYASAQVRASLETWRNTEETTWIAYVQASNLLAELLDMEPGLLFFPSGFGQIAAETGREAPKRAKEEELEQALKSRPEIKSAHMDLQSKTVMENFRENDLMPDISVSFSCSLSQASTYWGYGDWLESVQNVVSPDATAFYLGFVYRFPLGNRAAKSAYAQSRAERRKSRLAYQRTESEVVRQLKQAETDQASGARSLAFALEGLELKKAAYDKAEELKQEDARISEFELLSKFTEYVSARFTAIAAATACRQAEIQAAWATGTLLPPEWSHAADGLPDAPDHNGEKRP